MMEKFTEHWASSSNDARLWSKLLEKAKEGTITEPYFAVDIVEGSLQTSTLTFAKLDLPAAFVEHHRNELTGNIILEGPDGDKWPVMLGQPWASFWDPVFKPCLLQGWGEFATDCNLAVNDQILFFLWKDSHFLVQVFDSDHNIIKRNGGGTSAHIARTTLPQVTDPIESFGFKTTTPNILSLPSTNNNSGVAKNVHKEDHTTQASPSGEKLGNQEPGVEEDDDRVADFNAKSGEMVESFQSAPPSDAEEDQAWSMERARDLNRNITLDTLTLFGVHESYGSVLDPPRSALSVHDYLIKTVASVQETARSPVSKGKEPKFIEQIIPKKRARQAPTDRAQAVSASATSHGHSKEKSSSSSDSSANVHSSLAPQSGDGEGVDSELPNGGSELVFLVKRRSKTRLQGVGTHYLRMSDLSPHFHLSVVNAAKKLGVSPTTLKKACRKFGLKRWPGRKVRSLESTISGLNYMIAVGQRGGLEELNEAYMRSEVCTLQQEIDQLVHGTPAQILQKMHSPVVKIADLYKRLYLVGWRSKYHNAG